MYTNILMNNLKTKWNIYLFESDSGLESNRTQNICSNIKRYLCSVLALVLVKTQNLIFCTWRVYISKKSRFMRRNIFAKRKYYAMG